MKHIRNRLNTGKHTPEFTLLRWLSHTTNGVNGVPCNSWPNLKRSDYLPAGETVRHGEAISRFHQHHAALIYTGITVLLFTPRECIRYSPLAYHNDRIISIIYYEGVAVLEYQRRPREEPQDQSLRPVTKAEIRPTSRSDHRYST